MTTVSRWALAPVGFWLTVAKEPFGIKFGFSGAARAARCVTGGLAPFRYFLNPEVVFEWFLTRCGSLNQQALGRNLIRDVGRFVGRIRVHAQFASQSVFRGFTSQSSSDQGHIVIDHSQVGAFVRSLFTGGIRE